MREETFIRLVEAVESEGGELLPETHFPAPIYYETEGPAGRVKREEVDGTGCGQDTLLRIPYDDFHPDKEGVEDNSPELCSIKVCAIDDRMDLWPRYRGAVSD